jgi:hypothetical protein
MLVAQAVAHGRSHHKLVVVAVVQVVSVEMADQVALAVVQVVSAQRLIHHGDLQQQQVKMFQALFIMLAAQVEIQTHQAEQLVLAVVELAQLAVVQVVLDQQTQAAAAEQLYFMVTGFSLRGLEMVQRVAMLIINLTL